MSPRSLRALARLAAVALAVVGLWATGVSAEDEHPGHGAPAKEPPPPAAPAADGGYRPVVTPDGATLPFRLVDGVKVFHLIAEPVNHEFAPGLVGRCWGYNGRVHGPTIEAVEGDRVRIYVTNRLPAPTTVHWHGIHVPSGMDGVGGLSHSNIEPGETFRYEFTLRQHGTFMYHSHHDEMVQMAMGLMGMFVVHPREPKGPRPDRDFAILLSEWRIEPGAWRPDPNEMIDFNVLTFNGRVFPGTSPLVAKRGDRVRIRIGNLSATDHHPIHLHGNSFRVTETDGGQIPEAGRWPESTVIVPVGTTRTVELVADNPGDWALHCHMTHHTMNQMGHEIPNLVGLDPTPFDQKLMDLVPEFAAGMDMGTNPIGPHAGHVEAASASGPRNGIPMLGAPGPHGYIAMGGMFTVLKVREGLTTYDDPGWYENPPGTEASPATDEEMRRDLGEAPAPSEPSPPAPAGHPHGH